MSPWGTSRAGLLAVLSVMLWWTKVAGAEQHIERHGADTAAGAQVDRRGHGVGAVASAGAAAAPAAVAYLATAAAVVGPKAVGAFALAGAGAEAVLVDNKGAGALAEAEAEAGSALLARRDRGRRRLQQQAGLGSDRAQAYASRAVAGVSLDGRGGGGGGGGGGAGGRRKKRRGGSGRGVGAGAAAAAASRTAGIHVSAWDAAANADRLAVVVLLTDLDYKSANRTAMLHASLRLAAAHLLPTTPAVFYIFTVADQLPLLAAGLRDIVQQQQRGSEWVRLLAVPVESWVLPASANDTKLWRGHWNQNYRLMGDWRLSFMPRFARDMGHRYVLQMDDDSFIVGPVDRNLVQLFDRRRLALGVQKLVRDPPLVTWGLPELAKYFILTHQVRPTTLFQHCDPPGLRGLYSALDEKLDITPEALALGEMFEDVPRSGGWDRTILNGNCVMISLDFWFSSLVQRFVQLCRASGGSVMYRWNEQAVLGMVAQIFASQEQLLMFTFPYAHRIAHTDALKMGGLAD
ncbi:hypothetical protein CHLRE_05g243900v5 [Chlamydomonas reinhardtii]|uniref:Uncharacterized protein n=1 Tax=Chlamydomonas reinhardtii TaxID=3055 RepID=A0A2K3DSC6_CHLRE|nr:uncharacterized protein CHLRE_05g243900v5 [Chlamydomonas reinhardtii]PNW83417.1 hypothetical protein CHLRE_05g243900v5 [Chlamydomonas reinhardtii]